MDRLWVSDLRVEQDVTGTFLIRTVQVREHKSGSGGYLTLMIADRTGEVAAVSWDNTERYRGFAKAGAVVYVRGRSQLWNGALQVTIEHLAPVEASRVNPADFLPASARPIDVMLRELQAIIATVTHPGLHALLTSVFDQERLRDFARVPAGINVHHAYLGGLLEHTLEVVKLCQAPMEIHPEINGDLLITAALLHDVCKTEEYRVHTSFEYTDTAGLIGHLVLADGLITQKAAGIPSLPPGLLLELRHILLSHHGKREWQSPQEPKTLEAIALHLADYTSAQLQMYSTAIRSADGSSHWTSFHKLLERKLYVGGTTAPASLRLREHSATPADDEGTFVTGDSFPLYVRDR